MKSLDNANTNDSSKPYDGSDKFFDVTSKEIFILGLRRHIKNEEDRKEVIHALRTFDYESGGKKRDYFYDLEQEVAKFEIK